MSVLAVVVTMVAVLTLLNLFVLLGVIRRLREMADAEGPSTSADVMPAAGTRIGGFSITDVTGESLTERTLAEAPSFVVFLSPSCEPCRAAAALLADDRDRLPARTFVLVNVEVDNASSKAMLDRLAAVGTVAAFRASDGVAEAIGNHSYPMAVWLEGGVVVDASFEVADVMSRQHDRSLDA